MNHRFKPQAQNQGQAKFRVNERIKFSPVMVVDQNGENLGSMPVDQALQKARLAGLDLVEVAPNSRPPVCRILDYDKFKYEQALKEKKNNKNQKSSQVKEIRLSPTIEENDINVKVSAAQKFLELGHKVLFKLKYSGREMAHKSNGINIINLIIEKLKEHGSAQKNLPKMDGNILSCMIEPVVVKNVTRNKTEDTATTSSNSESKK